MSTMWILIWLTFMVTSGYAEITEKPIASFMDQILVASSQLSEKIDGVSNKVNSIETKTNDVSNKVNSMETKMDGDSNKVNSLEAKTDGVINKINSLEAKIDGVSNKVNSLDAKLDGVGNKVNSLETKMEIILNYIIKKKSRCNNTIDFNEESAIDNSIMINSSAQALIDIKENHLNLNLSMTESSRKVAARNCEDHNKIGMNTLEPVQIFPFSCCPNVSVAVLCDQQSDGGNWTLIQQRKVVDQRENFTRSWADYVEGFGELSGEFWIGLKLIHELTHQSPQELHIELEDWVGNKRFARYNVFSVGSLEDNYKLNVTSYSGDAGDSMYLHDGGAFSTFDRDNDECDPCIYYSFSGYSCAKKFKGGWWYKQCHRANLNGRADNGTDTTWAVGISWYNWRGYDYSLRDVAMKIRPIT